MTTIDRKEARRLMKAEKEAAKHSQARNQISRGTNLVFNILLIIFCILIIFPLWIIIISSVTSESALTTYGYRLWPLEFSTNAYTYLFKDGSIILTAYKNTLIATFAGTLLSVITVGLYAYALSRPDFRFKKFFTFFSFFTMLFGGGMVSYYNMTRSVLGLKDTVWALFLPMAFSAYWVIIMRTFYQSTVPEAIIESARIDGSGLPADQRLRPVLQPAVYDLPDDEQPAFPEGERLPYGRRERGQPAGGNLPYGDGSGNRRSYHHGLPLLPEVLCQGSDRRCGQRLNLISRAIWLLKK